MDTANGLRKNEIFDLTCDGMTSEGLGVFRVNGRAVFVRGALPGERWRVRVTKVTRTACYGRGEERLSTSPDRVEPACPNFGRCGGCALMHLSYEAELRFKLDRVNEAFRRIGGLDLRADEIIPSERTEGYRNKAVYAVGRDKSGEPVIGFYRSGSHEIIPAERCLLQTDAAAKCAGALLRFMKRERIPAYDEKSGAGAVRGLFVRSARDGGAVCCVVSASGLGEATARLAPALTKECPELRGVVLNINKTRGNTVLAGAFYTLWGEGNLRDTLCGSEFLLSPQAFYQINPVQAEKLYSAALEYAAPSPDGTALDLYCGAGTISLCLAKRAYRVIGAEIVPEAVENARENAARNSVRNAEFILADAGEAATELRRRGITPEVTVVDPPRRGMSAEAVSAVAAMNPRRVVYVSCNPATLARDLAAFRLAGYEPKAAKAVDMFPRTEHVETVVLLSKLAI